MTAHFTLQGWWRTS
ncbi:trp operon leader peptide [Enterobacter cloacae complex sp. P12RS]|nr:trp operon leader peptide [Enterobacter cloacae complex sp. P12RS]